MRLIDANVFMESLYHEAFETDTDMQKWESGCWIRYKMVEVVMQEAPTVDAVPVIRCRDCAFSEESRSETGHRWCHKHIEYVPNDYYCAGGKR